MEIIWYGQSCFLIRSKTSSIATDPYTEQAGLKLPKKLKADIVTISHDHYDHNNKEAVHPDKKPGVFVIEGPGEYGVNGLEIIGISSFHDSKKGEVRGKNTIYVFRLDDLSLAHLGDLGHVLSDKDVADLNQVDVLLIPVGGNYTIDGSRAAEVINQVDPKIVIPMHYKIPGLAPSIEIDSLDKFEKEIGKGEGPLDSIKITPRDLPEGERRIIILKPRV